MMEETGNNIWVRRIRDKHRNSPLKNMDRRDGQDGKDKDKDKTSRDSQSLQDVYCSLCGGHGHQDTQCDFSAKLLKTQESLKAIDQKRKMRLQANFKQEQQKRRARRLWKKVSTIRQLISGGAGVKEVDELLETLPELKAQQDDNNSTSEFSSSSSSSSDKEDDE
jgi:hypothetical protein